MTRDMFSSNWKTYLSWEVYQCRLISSKWERGYISFPTVLLFLFVRLYSYILITRVAILLISTRDHTLIGWFQFNSFWFMVFLSFCLIWLAYHWDRALWICSRKSKLASVSCDAWCLPKIMDFHVTVCLYLNTKVQIHGLSTIRVPFIMQVMCLFFFFL